MTKIKLCGMKREEDIYAANELGADYIGFVFAEKSRRFLSAEQAVKLKRLVNPEILVVGVFVDAKPEQILKYFSSGLIDLAQLHGKESEEDIRILKEKSGKPIIQAFQLCTKEDLNGAAESPADYILFDSGAGSGKVFDWTMLQGLKRPFFLAGGLSPLNVKDAIQKTQPFAVDVSSGIETDGRKDPEKMRAFVKAVRERTEKI